MDTSDCVARLWPDCSGAVSSVYLECGLCVARLCQSVGEAHLDCSLVVGIAAGLYRMCVECGLSVAGLCQGVARV